MTRFRMVLIVVSSALVFTFVGPFLYRAVGLDSAVGSCSPVGNNSLVGNNSAVGSCSSLVKGAATSISNSLSGGGQSGQVITVTSNTPVIDHVTLTGPKVSDAGGTVTYNIYSLSPFHWGWNNVASGGTVIVKDGVVPPSKSVTLDPGVYAWTASYSGDDSNAPSRNHRESGIEIVLPPFCQNGDGWMSVQCYQGQGQGQGQGYQGQGQGYQSQGQGQGYQSQGQGYQSQGQGYQGQGQGYQGQGQGYQGQGQGYQGQGQGYRCQANDWGYGGGGYQNQGQGGQGGQGYNNGGLTGWHSH